MTFGTSDVIAAQTTPKNAAGNARDVIHALLESRARWRELVRIGADLGFETGPDGRFTLVEPEGALGWAPGTLLGIPADSLLVRPDSAAFNPFHVTAPARNQRVWLRNAEGRPCCMLLSVSPISTNTDAMRSSGVRGLGVMVTDTEAEGFEAARTLCLREITQVLTSRMCRSTRPFAGIATALHELVAALQAEGAMLVLHDHEQPLRVAASAGSPWPGTTVKLQEWLEAHCPEPASWHQAHVLQGRITERSLLACTGANHFIDNAILLFWRSGPGWTPHETGIAASMMRAILPILEHEQIQLETMRGSMTDGLTGLFNRAGFKAELERRLDRLDSEGAEATLFVIGLDGFSAINDAAGLEAGDAMLLQAASVLRRAVRASDLIGRLGGDVFALWLDRADQFVAAERAHALSQQMLHLPGIVAADAKSGSLQVGFSIGIAVRGARAMESVESLQQRGWAAMRACKTAGGRTWQVSHDEPGV